MKDLHPDYISKMKDFHSDIFLDGKMFEQILHRKEYPYGQ